jgi:mitochondrial fission protein ELM1
VTELTSATDGSRKLVVWLLTDNKPGHRNQLQGLADALARHSPIDCHWLELDGSRSSWLDILRRRYTHAAPAPDMVIGAGHGTHRDLLAARRCYRAFGVVLMKPSLPLAWFDAAIVPRHDIAASERAQILLTDGVINTVTPAQHPDPGRGLILLGGESKHYHWHSASVAEQVLAVAHGAPQIQWQLTDSRRTPAQFLTALGSPPPVNLAITPHTETPRGWVAAQMAKAAAIWVTPDSVSMVYEALTCGAPTGVFSMTPKQQGRIVRGIERLLETGMLNSFEAIANGRPLAPPTRRLWEAERAAQWLLQRYRHWRDAGP